MFRRMQIYVEKLITWLFRKNTHVEVYYRGIFLGPSHTIQKK